MVEFKLPDVGEGMHEGEISKWLVREGELVTRDQPVVEVQTDKVNAELSSPVTGVIKKIMFSEGDIVEVGATLLIIEEETEAAAPPAAESKMPASLVKMSENHASPATTTVHRALATPYVRQLAREMKIDIEQIRGTGPAGRVTEEDVRRFAQDKQNETVATVPENWVAVDDVTKAKPADSVRKAVPKEQEAEERIPLKGIRKKIAEHMVKSVTIIPHVTHIDELEMDALKALRERLKDYAEERGIKLTFLPFFIKAVVIALKEFRTLNASIDDATNEIVLKNYYHIGIATDTQDGLLVPVIKDADRKTIFQLAEEIRDLASRAREGKLTLDEITGGTFTISNVGPIGGLYATPIINHPEVAILALHKMEPRMVVRDAEGVIRMMMNISLSFDHRLIDGVTAVKFTNRIRELLEKPERLFAEMV
ncbi:dihydrolipoamide acetyltransferase family protein [Aneurinibacillus thermoaerophilus]|uniref:dihydrolipoamide acetyltransferase family protein n=1 Tax=Aneurinibacillus thermoaerophilus TaxID=143495 RepID=UPI002E2395C0|nr:dihydrolipoamide acetyltransferase family protein [Aneurinibacillus thermoaerophilus]